MGNIIDGKSIAAGVVSHICNETRSFSERTGLRPGLAVCIVGDNPASAVYVRAKEKRALEAGFTSRVIRKADCTQAELLEQIDALNEDSEIHGILVQLPLPAGFSERAVIERIAPHKDVDGFHTENSGKLSCGIDDGFVPCTPLGCLHLLRRHHASLGAKIEGKNALIIGRSNIVGKPMASLLLGENATVTIAHSRTRELADICRASEIVVAAVGRAGYVKGDWIGEGAVVIDVGINRTAAGRLVGDVEFSGAVIRASGITPVPGGVGPMTIAMLLWNTLLSAHRSCSLAEPDLLLDC